MAARPVVSPLYGPVAGRIMAPQDACVFIPRTSGYVMLHGMGESGLQIEFKSLIS